jgi:hypothetical protein
MQRFMMTFLLCTIGTCLAACAPARPPVPVAIDRVTVRTEGAFVLVSLAYANPTATPLTIGLQPWASARTQLADDTPQSYTLMATFGIGYGGDPHDWLALAPQEHATVSFLFRANDRTASPPTRYTFTSEQQLRSGDAMSVVPFTLDLSPSVPLQVP